MVLVKQMFFCDWRKVNENALAADLFVEHISHGLMKNRSARKAERILMKYKQPHRLEVHNIERKKYVHAIEREQISSFNRR